MVEKEIIIDGTDAVLGRLASYAAKQALQGKSIIILNAEKTVVTGKRKFTLEKYNEKKQKGGQSLRGPFFPRQPERILKRTIRGMLPNYRSGKGKEALKRVLCYNGIPEKYKDVKTIKAGKEKHSNYLSLKEISQII